MSERPLIDKLQEATFGNATPMQWVTDKYALRMLLRKAHCFNIDAATSALTAEFSIAIATDLGAARHLAIPPFPVTWFEVDNIARLKRVSELGIKLSTVASDFENVVPRVGWLITPTASGHCASYVAEFHDGIYVAPTSFHWSTGSENCACAPVRIDGKTVHDLAGDPVVAKVERMAQMVCFGMEGASRANTDIYHATFGPASFQGDRFGKYENQLMVELHGELRYIWGLLIALGTTTAEVGSGTRHEGPAVMAKGKPLLPLEHKTLTIKLGKRRTVQQVVTRALKGARKRWHEVRAHTRLLKSGVRVKVNAHERGDKSLGKITKTYTVEK